MVIRDSGTLLIKSKKEDIPCSNDRQTDRMILKVVCSFLFLSKPARILIHSLNLLAPANPFRNKIDIPGNNTLHINEKAFLFCELIHLSSLCSKHVFFNNKPSATNIRAWIVYHNYLQERNKIKRRLVCTGAGMVLWLRYFACDWKHMDRLLYAEPWFLC